MSTFTLACGDVMPGCPARFEERSTQALLAAIGVHAAQEHQITEITPDVRRAVEAQIRVA